MPIGPSRPTVVAMPKASRTAVLVCQARAVADGRIAIGRFSDPIAIDLLDDDERREVETARGPAPRHWRDRPAYELLTATVEILAARTVAIDDAVRERRHSQLVVLGAGLDARAWRMRKLPQTTVFEVDRPASQADKRRRVRNLEPVTEELTFVPVEFGTDSLTGALESAGHRSELPTTWIWEGVLPYLTTDQVRATLADVAERSAPGSQLIATYPQRHTVSRPAHYALKTVFAIAGRPDPMGEERHVSAWRPAAMRDLLEDFGFTVVSDRDLKSIADDVGVRTRHPRRLANGHVVVAEVSFPSDREA